MSTIDPLTLASYLETDYSVFAQLPFTLRVGVANDSLSALYRKLNTNCCAYITAYNPFGELRDDKNNIAYQADLEKELKQRRLTYMKGIGKHPFQNWPAEPSFLVLDLSLEASKQLGRKFDQNAILWCSADAVPQLIRLR